jgi:hypothetical protein
VIAGGYSNTIRSNANASGISAGYINTIGTNASFSTIGGGAFNSTAGPYAFVAGGNNNVAGANSFAAGYNAQATNSGAFVWSDGTGTLTTSTNANSVTMRATGGVRFLSDSLGTGVSLAPGDTAWAAVSDRNAKKNFQSLDANEVLERLALVPVQHWNYKWEAEGTVPHIGPVAQDFKAAFYPGRDDKSITTLEFDGVELAAIQGLNLKLDRALKAKDAEIADLKQSVEELKKLVETLAQQKGGGQ